jgi:transposase InsO family protein
MEQEEILRQEAIRLHLQGVSIHAIASQLNKTRQWVYKWIQLYKQSTVPEWYKSRSKAPKHVSNKISKELERLVVNIRQQLSRQLYAQKGAISILYEFNRLGISPPSLPTINRILSRNNLIETPSIKRMKQKEYPNYFSGVQQMDLIGPKYLKGGFKFYFYTIIDTENHYAAVYPIRNKSAENIVRCLIDFWREHWLPDFLQMDNELSFRGSNRHPRGVGLLMRVALSNGVRPIFIPLAEPWRNGIVEKFNDKVLRYFYHTQTFSSFEELSDKARSFSRFHNENHRYSSQNNLTPNQLLDDSFVQFKLSKEIDLERKIPIEEGHLIFIRFIRSDMKLNILNSVFILKPELKYSYVVAEIIIHKHVLVVMQNTIVHHIFPFIMPLS